MSSVYFFLVAEASAISSAPNTISRGTFFSRASTSTSITSSRLPGAISPATHPSQFRHQPRPLDALERERHCLPVQFHRHLPRLGAAQHADVLPAPTRIGRAHPDLGLLPRKAGEVAVLAQRAVEGRGRRAGGAAGRPPATPPPAGVCLSLPPRTPARAGGLPPRNPRPG